MSSPFYAMSEKSLVLKNVGQKKINFWSTKNTTQILTYKHHFMLCLFSFTWFLSLFFFSKNKPISSILSLVPLSLYSLSSLFPFSPLIHHRHSQFAYRTASKSMTNPCSPPFPPTILELMMIMVEDLGLSVEMYMDFVEVLGIGWWW